MAFLLLRGWRIALHQSFDDFQLPDQMLPHFRFFRSKRLGTTLQRGEFVAVQIVDEAEKALEMQWDLRRWNDAILAIRGNPFSCQQRAHGDVKSVSKSFQYVECGGRGGVQVFMHCGLAHLTLRRNLGLGFPAGLLALDGSFDDLVYIAHFAGIIHVNNLLDKL